jgi:hypothetical protein
MIPSTRSRVREHTPEAINRKIDQEIAQRVEDLAAAPHLIDDRLEELDEEWDIERAIELNASALALTGVALGATTDRRFLILPALVTGFLLQHAVQGWCPPVPILRRLGFRTAQEIERERHMLKVVRADYANLQNKPVRRATIQAISRPEGPPEGVGPSGLRR